MTKSKISVSNKMKSSLKLSNIILYLGFMITLLNIGYFITLEEYQTIVSFVVITSVCSMFTKNILLLIIFGIVGMNIFYMIKQKTIENMENMENNLDMSYNSFKKNVSNTVNDIDVSNLEKENKEFVIYVKSNINLTPSEYYTEFKNKYREMSDTKWIDKNVIHFKDVIITDEKYDYSIKNETNERNQRNETFTPNETIDEMPESSNEEFESIINKLKETTPDLDLSKSLDVLNKLDINEVNKLINNMNTILQST
jgi:hypothetical protein